MSNIALCDGEVFDFAGGYSPFLRLIVLDREFVVMCDEFNAYEFLYETIEHETLHDILYKLEGWVTSKAFDLVDDEFDLMRREVNE